MKLYLIRHAHAVDASEDPARPLSRRGREQVVALATFLKQAGVFEPAEFWHSSLVRSRETAALLAEQMRLEAPASQEPGLEPEDDPRAIARRVLTMRRATAIVGHEPHLSGLATLLVAGKMGLPVFIMKKCSALALEGEGSHWSVRWHVSPELMP
jgi:phosphohistidine phosphatase